MCSVQTQKEIDMEIIEIVSEESVLNKATKLGLVHLKVNNLEDQVKFYNVALKMTIITKEENYAVLGDQNLNPLLYLKKHTNLKRYERTSGLYHFALLYPNEKELAKAIAWLMHIGYTNHPTDHGFSKTTYLKDLEGNDIELYIRTPERAKTVLVDGEYKIRYNNGQITDGRDVLNLDELYDQLTKEDFIDTPLVDMQMGHVHLYGYNVATMNDFYTKVIGYANGTYSPYFRMGDVNLSQEEYHVVAFNAWKNTKTKAPEDALGLDYYTITINDQKVYNDLLNRIKEAKVALIEENDEVFVFDPSDIKVKLELAL